MGRTSMRAMIAMLVVIAFLPAAMSEELLVNREYIVDFRHVIATMPHKEGVITVCNLQEWAEQQGITFPDGAGIGHGYRDSRISMRNTAGNHDRLLYALRKRRAFVSFPRSACPHSNIENLDARPNVAQPK